MKKFSFIAATAAFAVIGGAAANAAVVVPGVLSLTGADVNGSPVPVTYPGGVMTLGPVAVGDTVTIFGNLFNPDPINTEVYDADAPVVDDPSGLTIVPDWDLGPFEPLSLAPDTGSGTLDLFSFTAEIPDPSLGHGLGIQGNYSMVDSNDTTALNPTQPATSNFAFLQVNIVPEPGTFAMLGSSALMGGGLLIRRRRK